MVRNRIRERVTCEAKVENIVDLLRARRGEIPESSVRSIIIKSAFVDTGASMLSLPASMIRQLGFDQPTSTRPSRNTTGSYIVKQYGPVRLTIFDRDIRLDAMEVDDNCPVLIGQIPLEHLQLVVNTVDHRLDKSPEYGGEWILDAY